MRNRVRVVTYRRGRWDRKDRQPHRDAPVTRGVAVLVLLMLAGVVLTVVFCLPLLAVIGSML